MTYYPVRTISHSFGSLEYFYFEGVNKLVWFQFVKQVQAVLLLLGGRDIPTAVPTIEVTYDQNSRVIQN